MVGWKSGTTPKADVVYSSSLVCDNCNYMKLGSPEYARCYLAEDYLEAAERLAGTPLLSASYNAYQACELFLRELGGSYYYPSDDDGRTDDDSEFVPPSREHSLVSLRGTLEPSRRLRLDAKNVGDESFKSLLFSLPHGLWQLLRYGEDQGLKIPIVSRKQRHHKAKTVGYTSMKWTCTLYC